MAEAWAACGVILNFSPVSLDRARGTIGQDARRRALIAPPPVQIMRSILRCVSSGSLAGIIPRVSTRIR